MTAAVLLDQVAAYAAQVRAHLADLSPEQVDDLTDGLEADLTEALEDPAHPATGDIPLAALREPGGAPAPTPAPGAIDGPAAASIINLTERFGTPEAYAEELRVAAGLPAPRPHDQTSGPRASLSERMVSQLRADGERIVAQPWWPGARATAEALRPLWWVLRGWVLFNIVVTMVSGAEDVFFLPRNLFGILLLLAVVAASIQHGMGRWTLTGHGGRALSAVSLVAAIGLLPVLGTANAHANQVRYDGGGGYYEPEPIADGVYLGGEPVTNLFVYDADGTFIDQAQIIDDKGRGVRIDRPNGVWDGASDKSRFWSPAEDTYGRVIWNAFPLRMWNNEDGMWDGDTWYLPEGKVPSAMPPPFPQLAPVAPAQEVTPAPIDPSADPSTDPSVDAPAEGTATDGTPPADPSLVDPGTTDPAVGEPAPDPVQEPAAAD